MANEQEDEESFVSIGSAFEVPEEVPTSKKQFKVHEQIVVDEKGRRRFHGAFTGGFSAGYFNTVGTKEGWSPSTFVSSRNKRGDTGNVVQKPEDFMDEDDFGEFGIAPKKILTRDTFSSVDKELSSRKRVLNQAVKEGEIRTPIPGGLPVDQFIIPSRVSMGVKLLVKMGWKEGQGVGDKVKAVGLATRSAKERKVYGCPLPSLSASTNLDNVSIDIKSLQLLLAPKDVQPISFEAKNNTHGIGYSGLDPRNAIFLGATSLSETFKPTGSEKRGIRGQAFGVGAFEDEDDDIYTREQISDYDFSMTPEFEVSKFSHHGWSGPPRKEKIKGVLTGFKKASRPMAINKIFPPPALPSSFVPLHQFHKSLKKSEIKKSAGQNQTDRHFLNASDRAILLGEKEPKKPTESVFDMMTETDRNRIENLKQNAVDKTNNSDKVLERSNIEKPKRPSRWDCKIKDETTRAISNIKDNVGDSFKPFANDPDKQERYRAYLADKKLGKETDISQKCSMTEWEKEREIEEFSKASILFRPMSRTIASRFTRGAQDSNPDNKDSVKNKSLGDEKSDCQKAANLGLYGKLTRTIHEWHPNSTLCKRFNVPDPFPGSRMTGIPGKERKTVSMLLDLNTNSFEEVDHNKEKSDVATEVDGQDYTTRDAVLGSKAELINNDDTFPLRKPLIKTQTPSIKIGPLSYLNDEKSSSGADRKNDTAAIKNVNEHQSVNDEFANKPSMDIFKAIFDDSDESSDENELDDGDKPTEEIKNAETESLETMIESRSNDKSLDGDSVISPAQNIPDETRSENEKNENHDDYERKNSSFRILESKTTSLHRTEKSSKRREKDGEIFGPALPGPIKYSSNEKSPLQRGDLIKISSEEGTPDYSRDLKEHKKNKDKHKKHKKDKKHKKKHKKLSKKEKRKQQAELTESDSTDTDEEKEVSQQFHESKSRKANRKGKEVPGYHASKHSSKSKTRKTKRRKNRSKLSSDYSESDSDSERERHEHRRSEKALDREDEIPSAKEIASKLKKYGLNIKRMQAADFM